MHEHLPVRRLRGGLRLPAGKTRSTSAPIRRGFVPSAVVLSLKGGRGPAAEPLVAVGDEVLCGQLIAAPAGAGSTGVHASTSGRVSAIEPRAYPGYSGIEHGLCIAIVADGRHRAVDAVGADWPADRPACLERIARGGIVGLGGAAYPTNEKLGLDRCHTLVVNGAECEPRISCDDLLMREHAADVVAGSAIMAAISGAGHCIIAIERDKPEAIAAIHAALADAGHAQIAVAEIPTIYPAGGERQLIDVITGIEVPSGRYPGEAGILCQNVGTAYAVARLALAGEPLTSRIVTVTGDAVAEPANVEVPVGAPISELIAFCGGYSGRAAVLVHGGSMMGYTLPTDSLPVTKSTNCLIAAAAHEIRADAPEWPCIRCGECALACPAQLLPQELLIAARRRDMDGLTSLSLADCIECGCCDVVCPSQIPLTQTFRDAKLELDHARLREELSAQSAERFRRREERASTLAAAEAERQQSLKDRVDDPAARRDAIAAAVERARRRRRGPGGE